MSNHKYEASYDYSMNKADKEAFVYHTGTGEIVRISFDMILKENPHISKETLILLKKESDEMLRTVRNAERKEQYHTLPQEVLDGVTVTSAEEAVQRREIKCQLKAGMKQHLTPVQARRLEARFYGEKTLREVAEKEGVTLASVADSIEWALKKLREVMK